MKRFDPETGVLTELEVDGDTMRVRHTNPNLQTLLDRNKAMADIAPSKQGHAATRYVGSVDALTAAKWAGECGSAVGTPEFTAYLKRKLMDGDNAKFLVKGF